jgi:heat shock protein HslJ
VKALPLVGTTWQTDTLIQGAVAGATPAGVAATLVFGQDEVSVSGLCNLRAAKYRTSGSTVTFQLGPLTRRACAPEIMTVEQAAVTLLDGEATYRIDGRTLTITKGDKGLRFTAG